MSTRFHHFAVLSDPDGNRTRVDQVEGLVVSANITPGQVTRTGIEPVSAGLKGSLQDHHRTAPKFHIQCAGQELNPQVTKV